MRIEINKILLFFAVLFSINSFAFDDEEEHKKRRVDTVSAIVIAPTNPFYCSIANLNGDQIISMVDSMLDLDSVPYHFIKEMNEYAESRLLKHDFYNSLTAFYDNSPIPANSFYKKWDTKNISAYDESLSCNDTSLLLTLTDSINFCNFIAPLTNPVVTSNFGWRDGRNHNGIDLDLQVWDPVVAAFDGMVRIAQYHPGYGRVVVVRHYNGLETLYAHLHRFKVKVGDVVEAGQVVGLGGSSGKSSGSHLHFEVRFKGKALNPKHIIDFKQNKLVSNKIELRKNRYSYYALPQGVDYHTIKYGDYLYKIASQYGVSVKKICEMNGMKRNSLLIVGRKLRIN